MSQVHCCVHVQVRVHVCIQLCRCLIAIACTIVVLAIHYRGTWGCTQMPPTIVLPPSVIPPHVTWQTSVINEGWSPVHSSRYMCARFQSVLFSNANECRIAWSATSGTSELHVGIVPCTCRCLVLRIKGCRLKTLLSRGNSPYPPSDVCRYRQFHCTILGYVYSADTIHDMQCTFIQCH